MVYTVKTMEKLYQTQDCDRVRISESFLKAYYQRNKKVYYPL